MVEMCCWWCPEGVLLLVRCGCVGAGGVLVLCGCAGGLVLVLLVGVVLLVRCG